MKVYATKKNKEGAIVFKSDLPEKEAMESAKKWVRNFTKKRLYGWKLKVK